MEYTDQELLNWWARLSKSDQLFLLETMLEKMEGKSFPENLLKMYETGLLFSPKQLAQIRKWDHP